MDASDQALLFWGGSLGGLALADVYLHKRFPDLPMTLSWQIRERLHVEHPVGEAVFMAGLISFNLWFWPHIVLPARVRRKAAAMARSIS